MHYDPASEAFHDEKDLARELARVAGICQGCRLCVNLCPSFPNLLGKVDQNDGDVSRLTAADFASVVDDCFDCKRCYVKCPYTPPHQWAVDFPALMLRERAVRKRRDGIDRSSAFLARIDRAGRMNRWVAPLVNASLRLTPFRWLMEKALGIHRKADLPAFHFRTFSSWFRRRPAAPVKAGAPKEPAARVALLPTCYVNYNDPSIGKAAVAVLEHNGVEVSCPADRCCGMPFLDGGDLEGARRQALTVLPALAAAAREGRTVLTCQPTCTYMIRHEWPSLLPGEDSKAVAAATKELGEFLADLNREGRFRTDFVEGAVKGKVAYHFACHLQALETGPKSAELLRLVPGVTVSISDRCSGHDGTYAFRKETREASLAVGSKLAKALEKESPDHVSSDCPLAARQISGLLPGRPAATHPLVLLARAYGLPEGTP